MECDECNWYFSFWAIFCPFTHHPKPPPPNSPKNENIKKQIKKKHLEISSFNTIVPKITIICFTVPEIWHVMDAIVIFHFGFVFFSRFPYNSPKNQNFKNMKKQSEGRYHRFTHVYQKLWLDDVQLLRYGAQWKDRQTDKWKNWHIEVGVPPKKWVLK